MVQLQSNMYINLFPGFYRNNQKVLEKHSSFAVQLNAVCSFLMMNISHITQHDISVEVT